MKLKFDNVSYDSLEEYYFACYLKELKMAGFIITYERECEPIPLTSKLTNNYIERIELKTKTKEVEREQKILSEHIYTPDFKIVWSDKAEGIFYQMIGENKRIVCPFIAQADLTSIYSYVECKPVFDSQNMTRLFKINQKFIWEKYRRYINLIFPIKLFKETFTPDRYLFTPKNKKRKMTYTPSTLNQLIQ